MDDELGFHLQRRTDDLVRVGVPAGEAARLARLEFGNPDAYRDECRRARGVALFDDARADLRYAVRNIRRHALLSAIIVVTLTAGIGVSTGVFTLISAVVLRSHVRDDPASFVRVFTSASTDAARPGVPGEATEEEYLTFRDQSRSLRALAAYARVESTIGDDDGARRRVLLVSCNLFAVFGPEPAALGRLLHTRDCEAHSAVIVLSDNVWREQFESDPAIVGKSVRINGRPVTIVGVARPWLPAQIDGGLAWLPYTARSSLQLTADVSKSRAVHAPEERWLRLAGRLARGTSQMAAAAELKLIAARQDRLHPGRTTTVAVTDGAEIHSPGAAARIVRWSRSSWACCCASC